jgi:hypothetical protein
MTWRDTMQQVLQGVMLPPQIPTNFQQPQSSIPLPPLGAFGMQALNMAGLPASIPKRVVTPAEIVRSLPTAAAPVPSASNDRAEPYGTPGGDGTVEQILNGGMIPPTTDRGIPIVAGNPSRIEPFVPPPEAPVDYSDPSQVPPFEYVPDPPYTYPTPQPPPNPPEAVAVPPPHVPPPYMAEPAPYVPPWTPPPQGIPDGQGNVIPGTEVVAPTPYIPPPPQPAPQGELDGQGNVIPGTENYTPPVAPPYVPEPAPVAPWAPVVPGATTTEHSTILDPGTTVGDLLGGGSYEPPSFGDYVADPLGSAADWFDNLFDENKNLWDTPLQLVDPMDSWGGSYDYGYDPYGYDPFNLDNLTRSQRQALYDMGYLRDA